MTTIESLVIHGGSNNTICTIHFHQAALELCQSFCLPADVYQSPRVSLITEKPGGQWERSFGVMLIGIQKKKRRQRNYRKKNTGYNVPTAEKTAARQNTSSSSAFHLLSAACFSHSSPLILLSGSFSTIPHWPRVKMICLFMTFFSLFRWWGFLEYLTFWWYIFYKVNWTSWPLNAGLDLGVCSINILHTSCIGIQWQSA